jgi:hypothetical protein
MALAISSLSRVCRSLGQVLSAGINDSAAGATRVEVVIGTPSIAATQDNDATHRLNLFFFRFEPSGFFPDNLPGETWLVRMHCLLTPFCIDEDGVAAGENDLRVVGEVMRFFHEQPTFDLTVGSEQYLIQAVFLTLGLDQLNQLWSTQGDTVYRPSVLFEMSLAPVQPDTRSVPAPRVGSVGYGARATMDAQYEAPDLDQLAQFVPTVVAMRPNTRVEAWAPALCLVASGQCLQSASFAIGSAALTAFAPRAWVAGAVGSGAVLRWETWDATNGWQPQAPGAPFAIGDAAIDPEQAGAASVQPLTLPFTNHAGQMALYAERTFTRAADGATIRVRSNPVLITIHEA